MIRWRLTYLLFVMHIVCYAQINDVDYFKTKLREYRYSKYLDSSRIYFNKGLEIALKKKDSLTIFYLYKKMGDAYEHHQYIDSTLMMYDMCDTYIPKGNYKLKSFLLNDRAYTYQLLYDYDKSAELTLEALKMAERSGDKREIASVSVSLAEGFSNLQMNKQAEQYYMHAIKFAQFALDTAMLSYAHRYYGVHLINNKNFSLGYFNLTEALKFSKSLDDSISIAFVWHHFVDYFWHSKQTDSCFYYAKKAEGIWERRAEYIDYSVVCAQQGRCYLELGKYKEAEIYFKKAEKYIRSDLYFNEKLYSSMACLYDKKGNAKLAFDYLLKAKNLATTIKENESKAKLMSLRIKFETDQKETLILREKQKSEAIGLDAQNKTAQRNTILLILFFVLLSLGIIVFAYVKIKRKNDLLHKSNNDLENLAHQKQILLKEVHHRVKNNLTTLKSLLFLQAKASDNTEVKLVLEECQLRIQSMALIHQNLYEEGGKETVEFHQFIEQLFEALKLSFNPVDTEVNVEIQSNQVSLDISLALFLGLVLNELVTNSYKYAFKNKTKGKISLNLLHEHGKFIVTYYDDGIGLPNGFNETTEGFGFKLIRILTQQINAKLDYTYTNHLSTFTIIIDDDK